MPRGCSPLAGLGVGFKATLMMNLPYHIFSAEYLIQVNKLLEMPPRAYWPTSLHSISLAKAIIFTNGRDS